MNPQEIALVFPGQGSQAVGMAGDFLTQPVTAVLFEQADDVLGIPLSRLMREGPAHQLMQTENAQPALFVTSMAALAYLKHQSGRELEELVACVAGHSIGEYTAMCAAGCLTFEETLHLVRARGQAMAAAAAAEPGGMAAVLGLTLQQVQELAQSLGLYIANDNSPGQVVVAGAGQAVGEAEDILKREGAKKVVSLDVAGPFHTPYMESAAQVVADRLQELDLASPAVPLVMNIDAGPTMNPAAIRQNLVQQITHTVHWRQSMATLAEQGVSTLWELAPGKVLTGLAKRQEVPLQGVALASPAEIDYVLEQRI
jgi:[acyl-carrier-protein] S-malonyltransferase